MQINIPLRKAGPWWLGFSSQAGWLMQMHPDLLAPARTSAAAVLPRLATPVLVSLCVGAASMPKVSADSQLACGLC